MPGAAKIGNDTTPRIKAVMNSACPRWNSAKSVSLVILWGAGRVLPEDCDVCELGLARDPARIP